jgi:N-acetyl-anhydromuramyl-L-alanine amidase AmpD
MMVKLPNVLLISLLFIAGCSTSSTIGEDIPIEESIQETSTSAAHEGSAIDSIEWLLPKKNSRMRTAPLTHIMLHFTNNAQKNPLDPYNVEEVYALFEKYEVSAHYMIGREGEIYQLVAEERVAFHAGKGNLLNYQEYRHSLNDHSIGIEILAIGTKEEMLSTMSEEMYNLVASENIGYTDAQYEALNELLTDILSRYPSIKRDREHIIGHSEYAPVRKSDPGSLFEWSRIGF